jgi:predicted RNA-binding protein
MDADAERTLEETRLHKVRRNKLRRKALKRGLVLRETEHGYALLDILKSHVEVDGRMVHLNLDDVEAYLS